MKVLKDFLREFLYNPPMAFLWDFFFQFPGSNSEGIAGVKIDWKNPQMFQEKLIKEFFTIVCEFYWIALQSLALKIHINLYRERPWLFRWKEGGESLKWLWNMVRYGKIGYERGVGVDNWPQNASFVVVPMYDFTSPYSSIHFNNYLFSVKTLHHWNELLNSPVSSANKTSYLSQEFHICSRRTFSTPHECTIVANVPTILHSV